jgi:hypothetical protein
MYVVDVRVPVEARSRIEAIAAGDLEQGRQIKH